MLSIVTSLSSAEMIPSVTVPPSSPRGLPIATALSPTASLPLSPNTAAVRLSSLFGSIFSRATSLSESEPINFAVYSLPFFRVTLIDFAFSIT